MITSIITNKNGSYRKECRNELGEIHRGDGPAVQYFDKNKKLIEECYYTNDRNVRLDGPAMIFYYSSGKVYEERYYLPFEHRLNGVIRYDMNGSIFEQKFNVLNLKFETLKDFQKYIRNYIKTQIL